MPLGVIRTLACGLALALGLSALAPASAAARGPSWLVESERSGFTFEIGAGLGYQVLTPDGAESELLFLFPSGQLGLGWFFSDSLALLVAGTVQRSVSHDFDQDGGDADVANPQLERIDGVVVAALDYWPVDAVRLRFGVGAAYLHAALSEPGAEDRLANDSGVGSLLGIAVPFWNNQGSAANVCLDWQAGLYEAGAVYDLTVRFSWQLF